MIGSKYSQTQNHMLSVNQEYETPDELFIPLDNEFHFQTDLAASKLNYKIPHYYTKEENALAISWKGRCWLNPPFNTVGKWVKKSYDDSELNKALIVMLALVKSNTNWWRDYVMKAKEVRFINQKLQFKNTKQGLRFPACIVIFESHDGETKFSVFNQVKPNGI